LALSYSGALSADASLRITPTNGKT